MHNNYYFLRQLSKHLEIALKGCVVSECFSQSKDELVIRFETHERPFFIKASLLSNFSCLSFPENFQRARKNSVDLFENIIGRRIQGIRQFINERSFALMFDDDLALLFKMHGNRSNIILFEKDHAVQLFKNSIQTDSALDLSSLDRPADHTHENFIANLQNLNKVYVTFGKLVWHYLSEKGFDTQSSEEKWTMVQDTLQQLESPEKYFITDTSGTLALSLLPTGNIVKEHDEPIKAVTDFYYAYTQTFAFSKEKLNALAALKAQLQNYESYFDKTFQKLEEVQHDNNYKVWADLIMANLHVIPARAEKAVLENFYNQNQPTEIKLKKDLSPQKNAEVFYRKSKNQQIEIHRLQQALEGKEKDIEATRKKITDLESASDLKNVRSLTATFDLKSGKEKQTIPLPYHEIEFNGYRILIGKNAQSNDTLTLKHSFKDDLWLHAKDVAGSHVLIKYQSGKNFPKDVVARAAQLAAYHSKRKNETLCPVVVTPKKFVRKRKGDPAGAVVVEREEVIMVEPMK